MNVFAFYNPIHRDPLWDEADQRALIGLWDKSWRKHGWTPRLVNEDTAMLHPRYAQFYEKYHALPSGYGTDFDVACMMRYVAVAAKQEPMSMLSDYDVINYGFTPEDANRIAAKSEEANLVFFSSPDAANCGATLGPWKLFEALSEVFEQWIPDEHDFVDYPNYKGQHCSDYNLMVRLRNGTFPTPKWFRWEPGNIVWSRPGWETAALVHYGFQMKAAGHWPKWQHIEKLRPI